MDVLLLNLLSFFIVHVVFFHDPFAEFIAILPWPFFSFSSSGEGGKELAGFAPPVFGILRHSVGAVFPPFFRVHFSESARPRFADDVFQEKYRILLRMLGGVKELINRGADVFVYFVKPFLDRKSVV